jgi:phosphoglycerate dehydrogenase-like enzyme
MLAVLRRLRQNDIAVRSGAWREAPIGRDLAGLRVGIVGLGAIGRAVARRLVGFGCHLAATDPAPDRAFCEALSIELLDLPELASRSDVLTIHAPLLPATRSMIDRAVLDRLVPGSILVNTSRGPVVDEDALVEALRSGRLAGAGVDVYRDEPIGADHPLAAFPNVVMTGHVASFSEQGIARMAVATIDNLRALAAGTTPAGLVAPSGPGRPA